MPRKLHEARKLRETNTFPWSTTMVSGMMTGRAAACSSRASMSSSRCQGSAERDIASASAQPGRIGSGVTVRASSTLASTDLVVGRSTAAVTVLVATSIMPVRSTRPANPVVQAHQHIQRGGVHLHHLARRPRVRLAERPVRAVSQRPAGAGRPGGVLAGRQLVQQPVKTAL